jgi:hypothetical protein
VFFFFNDTLVSRNKGYLIPQGKPCTRAYGAFRSKLRGIKPFFDLTRSVMPCKHGATLA